MVVEVLDAWPQLNSMNINVIPAGLATTIDLSGANLSSSMTVEMRMPDGTAQSLPFTYVNSTKITVTIPAVTLATGVTSTRILLMPKATAQAVEDVHPFGAEVCDPALIE